VLDARKDEVFACLYKWEENNIMKIMTERAISPKDLLMEITEQTVFIGDGIIRYGDMIKDMCGDNAIFPSLSIMSPSAATVGEIAFDKIKQGDLADPVSLTPFYIRKSEAELKWKG
jgi:tRNA threonylcarbamoyladenosine biosynthesis protein TsaB